MSLRMSMVNPSSPRAVVIINLIVITTKVRTATYTPSLPISLAIVSSLVYSGVSSSSMLNFSSAIPDLVLVPTAQTMATPEP